MVDFISNGTEFWYGFVYSNKNLRCRNLPCFACGYQRPVGAQPKEKCSGKYGILAIYYAVVKSHCVHLNIAFDYLEFVFVLVIMPTLQDIQIFILIMHSR
jgi:hypothetical protein